ncbi:MAG TPA: hypothetical protein VFF89_13315 [Sphingobium sp.]|nr:hypothetical protein [Sphingobium sp.]
MFVDPTATAQHVRAGHPTSKIGRFMRPRSATAASLAIPLVAVNRRAPLAVTPSGDMAGGSEAASGVYPAHDQNSAKIKFNFATKMDDYCLIFERPILSGSLHREAARSRMDVISAFISLRCLPS